MVCTEVKLWFLSLWNISDQIHRLLCPKLLYFLRKCAVLKNKVQGCCTPLSTQLLLNGAFHSVIHSLNGWGVSHKLYLWSSTADLAHLTVVDLWCLWWWFVLLHFVLSKLSFTLEPPAVATRRLGLLLLVVVGSCRVHGCIVRGRWSLVVWTTWKVPIKCGLYPFCCEKKIDSNLGL